MKYLKKLFLILIIITLFMLIYSAVSPNVDVYTNSIKLNSDYSINYKVYNLFTNLTNKSSIIENNINSSNVGTYTIVINVKYLFFNVNKTVDINVIDNTKPIITLNGNTEVKVCPNTDYNEEGYTASDNYDGDITERVNIKKIDNISSSPVGYKYVVFITICVDGNMSTFDSHKLADNLEKDICGLDKVYKAIVHVNPI